MKKWIFLAFIAFFSSCINETPTGADLALGDHIPDFIVTMNDGTEISTGQLRQGISCIMFFTTICPDCQKTLPQIQRIYDEYSSQGIKIVLISREETDEGISSYWASEKLTMPYSAQKDRKIYEMFAKTRVPRVYINENGIIRFIFTDDPIPTYDDIKNGLDSLLATE